MFSFNKRYFLLTIILFTTEVLIATYLKTGFIRHYLGDFLIVILIYSFVKSFLDLPVLKTAMGVLVFAYLIELLQYLDFVRWIGMGSMRLANVVLGNYFDWVDMLAYTFGVFVIILGENIRNTTFIFKASNNAKT